MALNREEQESGLGGEDHRMEGCQPCADGVYSGVNMDMVSGCVCEACHVPMVCTMVEYGHGVWVCV